MKFIYGPVPSRRLGLSLGISPIPKKTCNYSCTYCQLGRTKPLSNTRKMFYPLEEIIAELEDNLEKQPAFDVVTIVGEGEPTLYAGLGELVDEVKKRVAQPVAVITNGALAYSAPVREELARADIVLMSLDAYDQSSFRQVNRPHGSLDFQEVFAGAKVFAQDYSGQLWLEIMLMEGVNDDDGSLAKFSELLRELKYDRLYLNTPVRPPAEDDVIALGRESMQHAQEILGGISIDLLASQGFGSGITDDYEAIISIIRRHPMNQFEVLGFLQSRGCESGDALLRRLEQDSGVEIIQYKNYNTYRLK